MQKRILLWALILGAIMTVGNGAWAQSDFYVIAAGPTAVGTKITSLPYTISNPGFYYLTGNLTYTGTGDAITINHNDVTLDLMGFSLFGPGSGSVAIGIHMSGRYNVEVRNGTVAGFNIGIWEDASTGANQRIINIRATFNTYGISSDGFNHLVKNCTCSSNAYIGIVLTGPGSLIADNVANNNVNTGIYMYGPGGLLGNTAINNGLNNFYIGNGLANSILVDRNSAFSHSPNYHISSGTTGVNITSSNSGQ